MNRSIRIQQLYGYAVCLVAIVTTLVAVSSLITAAMARVEPLRASSNFGYSDTRALSSYEAYVVANPEHRLIRRATQGIGGEAPYDTLTDQQARSRYQALRSDREAQVRFDSTREMLSNGVLLLMAVALFLWHWNWLRRLTPPAGAPDSVE